MALPGNVGFGTVEAEFIKAVADTSDPGREPDGLPLAGLTIVFTANVTGGIVLNPTAGKIIPIGTFTCTTDVNGVLIGPDGDPGIMLLATDDTDLLPNGWTWHVDITGSGIRLEFDFALPEGETVDLSSVITVPASGGQTISDGYVRSLIAINAAEATGSINGAQYVTADGATDDTAGLAAAVTAATASNLELVLPPGVIVTSGWTITPTAALKIRGAGIGKTTIKLASALAPNYLVRVNAGTAHRVEISDLTIDGNNVAMGADSLAALLGLTSRNDGLTVIHDVEIKNSTVSGLVAYNSAVKLRDSRVTTCVFEGVTAHGNYPTEISRNMIESCTRNGIRIGSAASTTKYDGVLVKVEDNQIRNITDAFAGTGQYGNGILIYRVANVKVTGNTILNTAWAFIRASRADAVVIANNIGKTNTNQAAIYVEFISSYATITGNSTDCTGGITVTNVNLGAFGSTIVGNTVKVSGSTAACIRCETGLVANNTVDGLGTARYGVAQIGGGVTSLSQMSATGNHISGVKYAIGLPATSTHADEFSEVSGNKVLRRDGNWVSFFGALGGSDADSGAGNVITTHAGKTFIDQPTESVTSGQEPTGVRSGSRLQIAGVLKTSNGTAWV